LKIAFVFSSGMEPLLLCVHITHLLMSNYFCNPLSDSPPGTCNTDIQRPTGTTKCNRALVGWSNGTFYPCSSAMLCGMCRCASTWPKGCRVQESDLCRRPNHDEDLNGSASSGAFRIEEGAGASGWSPLSQSHRTSLLIIHLSALTSSCHVLSLYTTSFCCTFSWF